MPDVKTIKKINYNGTEYLISGLATTSEDGLMSSGDKAKLDGLGGATVTGVKGNAESTYRTGDVNITPANIGLGNVENKSSATIRSELTSNNVTSALGYTPATQNVATTSSDGLMSADDKGKLELVNENAEVNQNAFSNIKIGNTTIAADAKQDTVELIGSNVTLTPDATNDKVTIGITATNVTDALGYTPPTTNTTYSVATSSTDGLMSKDDKAAFDSGISIANNAVEIGGSISADTLRTSLGLNNALHFLGITTTSMSDDRTSATVSIGGNNVTAVAGDVVISDDTHYEYVWVPTGISTGRWERLGPDGSYALSGHTHDEVSSSAAGFMSVSDKGKLDLIESGANYVSISADSPLSASAATGAVTISHDNSGVSANTYGVTATTALTPGFGNTFSVPGFTVNAKGHITAAGAHTVKIPNTEASTSSPGLMSADDKGKLDLIESNANNYVHPTTTAVTAGAYKVGNDSNGHVVLGNTLVPSDISAATNDHIHGNLTNDGKIGTDSDKAIYTGTGGLLQAGILPVVAGGTGTSTAPTAKGIIYANSTSAYASTGAGTSGYLLQSGGTDGTPSWINATNEIIPNTIVKRDGSGNISGNVIHGTLNGNASSANRWSTARTLTIGSTGKTVDGTGNVSWSLSEIGAAASSHTHGKITNDGKIASTNNVTIANNDRLIISDASDSYILKNTSITFDGSTTTKALTQKGTWETFTNNPGTVTSVRIQATSPVVSSIDTAQSSSLNTTISLADNYGDTKNPYASKTARYVLAAPANAAGTPSFRALTKDDISDFPSSFGKQLYLLIESNATTGSTDYYFSLDGSTHVKQTVLVDTMETWLYDKESINLIAIQDGIQIMTYPFVERIATNSSNVQVAITGTGQNNCSYFYLFAIIFGIDSSIFPAVSVPMLGGQTIIPENQSIIYSNSNQNDAKATVADIEMGHRYDATNERLVLS